jgi:hypothetical protein
VAPSDLTRRGDATTRHAAHGPSAGQGAPLVSTFEADVTPPIGTRLFRSVRAGEVRDSLHARGIVVEAGDARFVLVAVDWCELRNASYDAWRGAVAEVARTEPSHVLLGSVHQHDAPRADRQAEALLERHGLGGALLDPAVEAASIANVVDAVGRSLDDAVPLTAVSVGQAEVNRVASNRRWIDRTGRVRFDRNSTTRDAFARRNPVGTIDPTLTAVGLWSGTVRVAVVHHFAVHPMSRYGHGTISRDFVGDALAAIARESRGTQHIYVTGCSGDVTAGKYNDGDPRNRDVLAARLVDAMRGAMRGSRRYPSAPVTFGSARLRLTARSGPDFDRTALERVLGDASLGDPDRVDAALRLVWRGRAVRGTVIEVPRVSLGPVDLVVVPAETFVDYQSWAKRLAPPGRFVLPIGNGDGAPGYLPDQAALDDGYEDEYCWVETTGLVTSMRRAMATALGYGLD